MPTDAAKRKGVVLGYRLVGAIRIIPAAPKYPITAGNVKASRATAVIPIKNGGNTIDAGLGSVKVKGAAGTKNLRSRPCRSCPASRSTCRPARSSPRAPTPPRVALTQRGKKALSVTKKFKVK